MVRTNPLPLLVLLQLALLARGAVHEYSKEPLQSNFLMYRKGVMFSTQDAPAVRGAAADARAAIDVALDVTFPAASTQVSTENLLVQVSVMPAEAFARLGVAGLVKDAPEERVYCCSTAMAADGSVCSAPSTLLFDGDVDDVDTWDVFADDSGAVRVKESYAVPRKGSYYFVVSYCGAEGAEDVLLSGSTTWQNAYGLLPGELYGYLPFYLYMSMAYLLTALVWAYLCGRNWRDLLMLQNCMTAVLFFGLVEVYLRYYDFYHYNTYGTRSKFFLLSSVFFLCVKKTVSRLLVLVVAMGFGVLRPTLGENAHRVAAAGAAYFVLSYLQQTAHNLSHARSLTLSGLLMQAPVMAMDAVFLVWTMNSLNANLEALAARGQDTKLRLYTAFRRVLFGCAAAGSAWAVVIAACVHSSWVETHWDRLYVLEAFWDVLYLVVLVLMLYLWMPAANVNRYAYDRVATWDHDDEEYGDELEDVVASGNGNGNGKPVSKAAVANDE